MDRSADIRGDTFVDDTDVVEGYARLQIDSTSRNKVRTAANTAQSAIAAAIGLN